MFLAVYPLVRRTMKVAEFCAGLKKMLAAAKS